MEHILDAKNIKRAILVGVAQHGITTQTAQIQVKDVPQSEGKLLSQLYKRSEILQQDFEGNDIHLRIRLSPDYADRFQLDRFELA